MTEEIKNVNAKIDEAEAAVKKYASKDTVISIGGYEFTPAAKTGWTKLVVGLIGSSAVTAFVNAELIDAAVGFR